jgi:hypothetical protein
VFNIAMADGSVKSIAYNIDLATFRNLTVRNDGKSPRYEKQSASERTTTITSSPQQNASE